MKVFLIPLIFLSVFLSPVSGDDVRYYRSEDDFRRGVEIPAVSLGRKPYMEVHFNQKGDVVRKIYYRKKIRTQFEEFTYDSTSGTLKLISVFDTDSTLLRKFIFGPHEEMSEKYIRYVYGINRIRQFDDRFTGVEFIDGEFPSWYRFFDVDAFLYGLIKRMYNRERKIRQEDWVAQPGNRLMRRYLYTYHPDSETTEIWEYDSTKSLVMHLIIGPDGLAPLYTVSFPTDSSSMNSSAVSYHLLDKLTEGKIIWEWKGGKPDESAPHEMILMDQERMRGEHLAVISRHSPELVDSALYTIRFTGEAELGYPVREIVIDNVLYDITPPVYTITSETIINNLEISLVIDESLSGGEIQWVWESGERDAASPHVLGLSRGLLKQGEQDKVSFPEEIDLNDGSVYTLLFIGKDLAGNLGSMISVPGILFDSAPPIFTWIRPDTGDFISSNGVSYMLNEELVGGELVWTQVAGENDIFSPHKVPITGTEAQKGLHQYILLKDTPQLVDGSVYQLEIYGEDLAGNVSDTVLVPDIICDFSPPIMNVYTPQSGQIINAAEMVYNLNEDLISAKIEWHEIVEDSSPDSPYTVELDSTFLSRGDHRLVDPELSSHMKEGTRYRIWITGRDLAGNEARPFEIENVVVDVSPPLFSDLFPFDSTYISSNEVSYMLSETLSRGEVIWTQVAGNSDQDSPHTMNLAGESLEEGKHEMIRSSESMNLVDGSIYDVRFVGIDHGGNQSEETIIHNVIFDLSPPEIELVYPVSNSVIPSSEVSYNMSELLKEGSISWKWIGGNIDKKTLHVASLVNQELYAGQHELDFLTHTPELVNGAIYSVVMEGTDFGGKTGTSEEINRVRFDSESPTVAVTTPSEKSTVNSSNILYTLSEALLSGIVIWTNSGGEPDSASPHIVSLEETELIQGEHGDLPFVHTINLVNGSLYDISFFGSDSAGNISDTMLISNIFFDNSKPGFEVSYPMAEMPTRDVSVAYTISENISKGSVKWRWTGGSPDGIGEHVQSLSGEELLAGAHPRSILLSTHPALVDGGIYTVIFSGRDLAGNLAPSIEIPSVLYDATAPAFSDISPTSGEYINNSNITYTLSESVVTGTIIWRMVGGRQDLDSPHLVKLVEDELSMGLHENILPRNNPSLGDSSIYDLVFFASDEVGNVSDSVLIKNVFYDFTNPRIDMLSPLNETFISNSNIGYFLSEDLAEGRIIWERISGNNDPNSPHNRLLTGDNLLAGEHPEVELENAPRLVEGARYSISISGRDKANNNAEPVTITNVEYDVTAPRFFDILPLTGSFVNHTQVSYSISDRLETGQVIWTRVGGNEDPDSPHKVFLQGEELNSGSHPLGELVESPPLGNGTLYSIQFVGIDPAGNVSDTVRVDSITYDAVSPQFTVDFPVENSVISSSIISYTLSEKLVEGRISWERLGGNIDEASPHIVSLQSEELERGEHLETLLTEQVELVEGTIYRLLFSGKDIADNEVSPIEVNNIIFDATPPTITQIFPVDSINVNHNRISYMLSETVKDGQVIWTRISGNEDPDSPHILSLVDEEKNEGLHEDILLANLPDLKDGSIYGISLAGTDLAGNMSDTISVSGISFDITPPVIEIKNLSDNSNISSSDVVYNLSEDFSEATIIWNWIGGDPDSNAPYEQILTDESLSSGEHDERLENAPVLVEGSIYSVVFNGVDRAGNSAETIEISQVQYDATPPSISVIDPQPDSYINKVQMSYLLSENLKEGTVRWIRIGGVPDPVSPHEVILTESELKGGEHVDVILEDSPELQDGSIYEIRFRGVDFGAMESDTVKISGIRYDITPPEISATHPEQNSSVNHLEVSYSLSEVLKEGSISWKRTSGPDDPLSPHIANLSVTERDTGEHSNKVVSSIPQLVDGVTYTITFSGVDSVGNSSEPFIIEGITYDLTPPSFTVQSPMDSSYQNQIRLSYSLSESLFEGAITWTRIGGTEDGASPHVVELSDEELTGGDRSDISLSLPIDLKDGAVYDIDFSGVDQAGNEAETISISNVIFDVTPPDYTISYPEAESYIDSVLVSYHLNEELLEGTFTWTRTGGENDPNSPHIFNLSDSELSDGDFSVLQPLNLVSGSLYTLSFLGTDLAGNEGEGMSVQNISFDNVPPEIVVDWPVNESAINDLIISYSLSETMTGGTVTWSQTGGSPDGASPHIADLISEELVEGEHNEIELAQELSLQDGAVYDVTFEGEDLAGNRAQLVTIPGVLFDIADPVITFNSPSSDSAFNSPVLSFELSENLDTVSVTWERVGGSEDPNSPQVSNLINTERSGGIHEALLLSETPQLVDGVYYRITMAGVDKAGNVAEDAVIENVLFDVSPPVIVANYPAPSSTVGSTEVSYSLSEELAEGTVTWTRTGGTEDPRSPHDQSLVASEKTIGDHQEIVLSFSPGLSNNTVYTITFDGFDAAGNSASEMIIESVTFDNEKPVLTLQIPDESLYINEPAVSYTLSETLAEGKIIWSRESGSDDPDTPHVLELKGEELSEGEHQSVQTTQPPILKDGTLYSVSLSGTDSGGNQADSVSISGIMYDISPPLLTLDSPGSDMSINSTQISYTINEDLSEGNATWTRSGGNNDPSSPHIISLSGEELSEGTHQDFTLANQSDLVESAIYNLTITGRDLAGNEMEEVTVNNIHYDSSPPQFSQIVPVSNSFINSLELNYTLSETLSTGEISWTRVGGGNDPGSPHTIELMGEELFPGVHENIILTNVPALISGTSYTLAFIGTDLAGNQSDRIEVENITFDDTPPVFTAIMPFSSSFVNFTRLSYELSEPISSGMVTWIPKDGGNSLDQSLSETELEMGLHENIELINPPKLDDGKIYDIKFDGMDAVGNEAESIVITDVTYDVTIPKIKITLDAPAPRTFMKDTPVTISNSEMMSEIIFTWTRESGAEDPVSPHNLALSESNLVEGEHSKILIPGAEVLQVGTVYTLTVTGKDLAGNEATPQPVENIDIIRELTGEWLSKTALLTAVWTFGENNSFSQGVMMGTRISQQQPGKVSIDFSKRPFELKIDFEEGFSRYGIFEFTGQNTIRVAFGERRPKSWSEGDLMEFQYNQPGVP